MDLHRQIPTVSQAKTFNLGRLRDARGECPQRICWSLLFLRAYALTSVEFPELRQTLISWPWRHLYEHPQTMGNLAKAADHFEDALAFCRTAGYRPELAWTCCDYADMLRERDGEGDHAKAVSLQDEALAISSELGMRPLMERVLSRREILKA